VIVDFRVRLPLELWPADARELTSTQYSRYDEVLKVNDNVRRTVDDLEAEVARSGVDHIVVHAEFEYGDVADQLTEAVASFVAAAPRRRTGFGTVSLGQSSAAKMAAQVRRCAALGLKGVNVQPAFFGRSIDDSELFAVYAAADELGLVVAIHTGVNYDRTRSMAGEHPLLLDRIAVAFPELQLVACHAAWPWTAELAAVARRHPTVSFDFGGMAPRYLDRPSSGWAPLMSMIDNVLSEQCLFATDWPVVDHRRAMGEWTAIDLKPSSRERLMGGNAARLLGLDPPAQTQRI
jgi:uncharacterized protein